MISQCSYLLVFLSTLNKNYWIDEEDLKGTDEKRKMKNKGSKFTHSFYYMNDALNTLWQLP